MASERFDPNLHTASMLYGHSSGSSSSRSSGSSSSRSSRFTMSRVSEATLQNNHKTLRELYGTSYADQVILDRVCYGHPDYIEPKLVGTDFRESRTTSYSSRSASATVNHDGFASMPLDPRFLGLWQAQAGQKGDDPDPERDEKFLEISSDGINFSSLAPTTDSPNENASSVRGITGGGGPYPRSEWELFASGTIIKVKTPDDEAIDFHLSKRNESELVVLFDYDPPESPVEVAYGKVKSYAANATDANGGGAAATPSPTKVGEGETRPGSSASVATRDSDRIMAQAYAAKKSATVKDKARERKRGREECCFCRMCLPQP